MKQFIIVVLFNLFGFAFAIPNQNSTNNLANITKTIKANLQKTLPGVSVNEVNNTPIKNLYEVVSGHKIFYVDSTGNYALLGNLIDLSTKQSLTEQKVNSLSNINWQDLPLNIAIVHQIGNGTKKIAVFTDPDCTFCQRLEAEVLSKLKNITIYYFLFPLPIHANAANNAKKILCAQNSEQTFINYMTKGSALPANTQCKNVSKLAKMIEVGTKIVQVEGTPTIVLENGKIISGLTPVDYLAKQIDDTVITKPGSNESSESIIK